MVIAPTMIDFPCGLRLRKGTVVFQSSRETLYVPFQGARNHAGPIPAKDLKRGERVILREFNHGFAGLPARTL